MYYRQHEVQDNRLIETYDSSSINPKFETRSYLRTGIVPHMLINNPQHHLIRATTN